MTENNQSMEIPLRLRLTGLHRVSVEYTTDSSLNEKDVDEYMATLDESPSFHLPPPPFQFSSYGIFF